MQTYATKDFYLTGFILSQNVPLVEYTRDGASTTFHFEPTDKLNQLIGEYYGMHATVNPFTYGQALKHLKGLIHSNIKINLEINNHVKQSAENPA